MNLSSRNAGVAMKTSAVCPLQSQGSLQMKTSPGRIVSGGKAAIRFLPNTGITPVWPVAPSQVWAIKLPRASQSPVDMSWTSITS